MTNQHFEDKKYKDLGIVVTENTELIVTIQNNYFPIGTVVIAKEILPNENYLFVNTKQCSYSVAIYWKWLWYNEEIEPNILNKIIKRR